MAQLWTGQCPKNTYASQCACNIIDPCDLTRHKQTHHFNDHFLCESQLASCPYDLLPPLICNRTVRITAIGFLQARFPPNGKALGIAEHVFTTTWPFPLSSWQCQRIAGNALLNRVNVLQTAQDKTGHLRNILLSQPLGAVLKNLNLTQEAISIRKKYKLNQTNT